MERKVILFPSYGQVVSYRSARALAGESSLGVSVLTPQDWVSELWTLWGSGQRLVSLHQRFLLVQSLLKNQNEIPCSPGSIALVASCFENYLSLTEFEQASLENLSAAEARLVSLSEEYRACVKQLDLIERNDVLSHLKPYVVGCTVELREFSDIPLWLTRFLDGSQVQVIESISDLAQHGLNNEVHAEFLHPAGSFAQGNLLAQRMMAWHSENPEVSVCIISPRPADCFENLKQFLLDQGWGATCAGTYQFSETFFGRAFITIASAVTNPSQAVSLLQDFVFSPYAGLSGGQKNALDMKMRTDRVLSGEDALQLFRTNSRTFQYFEDLTDSPDASIVLGFFEQYIRSIFATDAPQLACELKAVSLLRSLYEEARVVHATVVDILAYLDQLKVGYRFSLEGSGECFICTGNQAQRFGSQSFDAVVVTDLTTEQYPAKEDHSALVTLLTKLGLPVSRCALKRLRTNFFTWQNMARNRFASMRIMADGDGGEVFPAFFEQEFEELCNCNSLDATPRDMASLGFADAARFTLGEELLFENAQQYARSHDRFTFNAQPMSQLGVITPVAQPVLLRESQSCDCHTIALSPSAMESYVNCPYSWFVNKRIIPSAPDEGFGPLEMGVFSHAVMANFYSALKAQGTNRLTPATVDSFQSLFEDIFQETLDNQNPAENPRLVAISKTEELSIEQLKKDLWRNLTIQAELFDGFEPYAHEFEIKLEQNCSYAGVRVTGRVDRIDVDHINKTFVVVDYKGSISGHAAGYNLDKAEDNDEGFCLPAKIQALVYAQVLRRLYPDYTPIGALYLNYRATGVKGSMAGSYVETLGLLGGEAPKTSVVNMSFTAYLDMVEEEVARHLDSLKQGIIEQNPSGPHACKYCPACNCSRRLS